MTTNSHQAHPPDDATALLEVRGLSVHHPIRSGLLRRQTGVVRAVDGVSLTLHADEILGLVGESGCGKTTLAQALMQLIRPTAGEVWFRTPEGWRELLGLTRRALRPLRRHMQLVFQNPDSAMNPQLTAGEIVAEPLRLNERMSERALQERVGELMESVGLKATMASRPPAEFSGGQRQRLVIARALALSPRVIVADEAVSALDVSVQAQILNLLNELQQRLRISMLFISHNLQVVRYMSHRIAVMYKGRIVELGPAEAVYRTPRHPYTEVLLAAIPSTDPARRHEPRAQRATGEPPGMATEIAGCPFNPRCVHAQAVCRETRPELRELETGHRAACHFAESLALAGGGEHVAMA